MPAPRSDPVSEGRAYGGESPPDDRLARRRRQLLDAGHEVFGTIGHRAATVRGVCRLAQVTEGYFYESFLGLEDLLLGVYEAALARLRDAVVVASASMPDEAPLETVAMAGLDAFFTVAGLSGWRAWCGSRCSGSAHGATGPTPLGCVTSLTSWSTDWVWPRPAGRRPATRGVPRSCR